MASRCLKRDGILEKENQNVLFYKRFDFTECKQIKITSCNVSKTSDIPLCKFEQRYQITEVFFACYLLILKFNHMSYDNEKLNT